MAARSLLMFFGYAVDRDNEQLLLDNQPVRLTNKAFTVLRYLVEHPGQLVTKDAFFAAIWPETIVSETTLTNCIGELRLALADDPKHPRFIETVHRRGYRFIAPLSSPQPVVSYQFSVLSKNKKPASAPILTTDNCQLTTRLVGREAELTQLHNLFIKAVNGERQMVFVTGEAGIGKTTLIETFPQSRESEAQAYEEHQKAKACPACASAAGTGEPSRRGKRQK